VHKPSSLSSSVQNLVGRSLYLTSLRYVLSSVTLYVPRMFSQNLAPLASTSRIYPTKTSIYNSELYVVYWEFKMHFTVSLSGILHTDNYLLQFPIYYHTSSVRYRHSCVKMLKNSNQQTKHQPVSIIEQFHRLETIPVIQVTVLLPKERSLDASCIQVFATSNTVSKKNKWLCYGRGTARRACQ